MTSYTLIGSLTSPFVRRIRMVLEGLSYEMKVINIYEKAGNDELHRYNPIHQIPCLLVDDQPIWDSRIIAQYLAKQKNLSPLLLADENRITAVERLVDAGVILFLLNKSGISLQGMYPQRLKERISSVLQWLKPWLVSSEAAEWNEVTLMAYAGLDWLVFRNIDIPTAKTEVLTFLQRHAHREIVKSTDPRLAP